MQFAQFIIHIIIINLSQINNHIQIYQYCELYRIEFLYIYLRT